MCFNVITHICRVYYEQPHIVHQCRKYLRQMRCNRTEGRPVVYLVDSWANAHDGKSRAWIEVDKTTGGLLEESDWSNNFKFLLFYAQQTIR